MGNRRLRRTQRRQRGTQRRAACCRRQECCRRQDCQCVLGITKDTKDTKQAAQGRAVRARKAHVRPGGLEGVAGFARHALGKGADAHTARHGVFRRFRRCRRYRSAADAALHNGFACRPAGALSNQPISESANQRGGLPPLMARLEGFEPPTRGLEGRCSIQLSYRRNRCMCHRSAREAQSIQSSSSSWGKARSQRPREMRKSESCFQPSSVV